MRLRRATTIQNVADAIQFLSVFPKDNVVARRVAYDMCQVITIKNERFLPSLNVQRQVYCRELNSAIASASEIFKYKMWVYPMIRVRKIITAWATSSTRVCHLLHLAKLAQVHSEDLQERMFYPDILKISLCVHGNQEEGASITMMSESLSSLLHVMVMAQGLEATQKQLLACLYQVATSVSQVRAIRDKFPYLVEKFDEVFQREQLSAMLLVSNDNFIVMNLFHQYQIDHRRPLPKAMYDALIMFCLRFYRLYFLQEILHIMVFRDGIKPELWIFREILEMMEKLLVSEINVHKARPNVSMELCHFILSMMDYAVDQEDEVYVFSHLFPVFTLINGMKGFNKLQELYEKRRNGAIKRCLFTATSLTKILKHCKSTNNVTLPEQVFMESLKLPHTLEVCHFKNLLENVSHPRHLRVFLPVIIETVVQYVSDEDDLRSYQPVLEDALMRVHKERLDTSTVRLPDRFFKAVSSMLIETLISGADDVDASIAALKDHVSDGDKDTISSVEDVHHNTSLCM